jgi:hypothetical protein
MHFLSTVYTVINFIVLIAVAVLLAKGPYILHQKLQVFSRSIIRFLSVTELESKRNDPNWTTIICFRIASLLIFRKRIQISASILAFSFRFLPSTFENDNFSFFIYSFYHCLCKKSYKNTRKNFKEKDVNSLRLLGIVLALQSQR